MKMIVTTYWMCTMLLVLRSISLNFHTMRWGLYALKRENWSLEFKVIEIIQLVGNNLNVNSRVADSLTPWCSILAFGNIFPIHPFLSIFTDTAWSKPSWASFKLS